ncbi:hypothetical protein COBT_001065 [Conglomerata obtusa]
MSITTFIIVSTIKIINAWTLTPNPDGGVSNDSSQPSSPPPKSNNNSHIPNTTLRSSRTGTNVGEFFIFSVGAEDFIGQRIAINGEISRPGGRDTEPLPYYMRKMNNHNGVILSVLEVQHSFPSWMPTLDISWLNSKVTSHQYHGEKNQIFYFEGISGCFFRMHDHSTCIAYDKDTNDFNKRTCPEGNDDKDFLFMLYRDTHEPDPSSTGATQTKIHKPITNEEFEHLINSIEIKL